MERNFAFRLWFYFRNGWSMYFAFIFAAINTLTVTYFLAIEKVPALTALFPSFPHYVGIFTLIGIPLLVLVGYAHWKKTKARKAEVDIAWETNPYLARTLVNSEISLTITMHLIDLILKSSQDKTLTKEQITEIEKKRDMLLDFINKRDYKNKSDIDFLKKEYNKS